MIDFKKCKQFGITTLTHMFKSLTFYYTNRYSNTTSAGAITDQQCYRDVKIIIKKTHGIWQTVRKE